MKTFTKTTITQEPRIQITLDPFAMNPRDPIEGETNLGYFITVDRDYTSPNQIDWLERLVKDTADEATGGENHIELIKQGIEKDWRGEKVLAIYPIVKNEHGNVYYHLGERHGFDYSNNGFYIITEKTQKETGVKPKDFEAVIKEELEHYSSYVNGDIYRVDLFGEDGEYEDGMTGYYDLDDLWNSIPGDYTEGEDMQDYLQNL